MLECDSYTAKVAEVINSLNCELLKIKLEKFKLQDELAEAKEELARLKVEAQL